MAYVKNVNDYEDLHKELLDANLRNALIGTQLKINGSKD